MWSIIGKGMRLMSTLALAKAVKATPNPLWQRVFHRSEPEFPLVTTHGGWYDGTVPSALPSICSG